MDKDMVTISKDKLEELERKARELEELKKVDWELVGQFKEGLEDLKAGRIRRVA